MTGRRRRKQGRFKRWFLVGAIVVVAGTAAVVWWQLPAVVGFALKDAAKKAGFDSVSFHLDRMGLDGAGISDVVLQNDGLDVSLSSAVVTYTPGKLLAGNVNTLQVSGLEISLDFTKARKGLLPAGLNELISSFEGGGGGFQFPVHRIDVLGAKAKLILPEETHLFSLDLTSEARPDGRVEFEGKLDHPDQRVSVEGIAETKTLDADITVLAADTRPELYLSMARQLGVFESAETLDFDSASINAEGSISVKNGEIASILGSFQLPEISAEVDGTLVVLSDVKVESRRDADGVLAGSVGGRLSVSGADSVWRLEPMTIEAALSQNIIDGLVEGINFTRSGLGVADTVLKFQITDPWSPGLLRVNAEAEIGKATVGEVPIRPFSVVAQGDVDKIEVNIAGVGFANQWPVFVSGISATIDSPFGSEKSVAGGASVTLQSPGAPVSGGGWSWRLPAGEQSVLRTEFVGRAIEGAFDGNIKYSSESSRLEMHRDSQVVSFVPIVSGEIGFDSSGVEAESVMDLRDIRQNLIAEVLNLGSALLEWKLPKTSFETLAGFVNRDCEGMSFQTNLSGSVDEGGFAKAFSLNIRRSAETESWDGTLLVDAIEENLRFNELSMSGVKLRKEIRFESVADRQFFHWVDSENRVESLSQFAAGSEAEISFAAQSVSAPGGLTMEWVAGSVQKSVSAAARDLWNAEIVFDSGRVRVAGQDIEQVRGDLRLSNGMSALDLVGRLSGVVEGSSIAVDIAEQIFVDWEEKSFAMEGVFSLPEFAVSNSDWIGRRFPEVAGLIVSGTASGHGNMRFDSTGDWDADLYVSVVDGSASLPGKKTTITGLEADLSFDSLRGLRTLPGQRVRFDSLNIGNLAISNGEATFRLNGADQVVVEGVGMNVFGGVVSTGTFSLFFPDPDVALTLVVKSIDISQVVRHFDLFDGEMTGRLQGHVPIGLLAGTPVFGEGYLRLDDEYPSKLVYHTHGAFTRGLPTGMGFRDQVNRIGYELLEEGLESVNVESVEIKLFDREVPGTPIRIEVIGSSQTDRAEVPFVLKSNINGSVAEVLDFLYRLVVM